MQLGTEGAPESLHAMQLLAPVLVHDCFLQQRISQRTFDAIQSLFPDLLFFGYVELWGFVLITPDAHANIGATGLCSLCLSATLWCLAMWQYQVPCSSSWRLVM